MAQHLKLHQQEPTLVGCILLSSCKRRGGERSRAKLVGRKVLIWSGEHYAWWRPGRAGYTTEKSAAGVYDFEDAWQSTKHCGPEKRIDFMVCKR